MIFTQKNKIVSNIQTKIGKVILDEFDTIKYLVLVLDEKLNWQVEHIKHKVIPLTGVLNRCNFF